MPESQVEKHIGSALSRAPRMAAEQLQYVASDARRDAVSAFFWATLLAGLAYSGYRLLGNIGSDVILIWLSLMYIWSMLAGVLSACYANASRSLEHTGRWLLAFGILYFLNGLCWSALIVLFWIPDLPTNHLFITVIVMGMVITYVLQMSSHSGVFTAAILPPPIVLWVVYLMNGGELTPLFSILIPFFTAWLLLVARTSSRKIVSILDLQFRNQDLLTELSRARDEAVRRRAEAENASRAKSSFLANMSHELRTPLNAILGFSDLIRREIFGPVGSPRYLEYATDIHSSGEHLLSLINDILDLSKIEAGKLDIHPEPLSIRALIDDCVCIITEAAENAGIRLIFKEITPGLCVMADARALKQTMLNLLSNAIKFTPAGGLITLSARREPGKFVEITVLDTGEGIPPERIDIVMQPFEQVDNHYDRARKGTGLGLALVNALVQMHGGHCKLKSQLGKGTEMSIYLPDLMDESGQNPIAKAACPPARLEKLVVD